MMTGASWIKRAIVLAMFGVLDSAALCGEAYDHFKRRLLEQESPDKTVCDDVAKRYSLYLGVLFLLGYTVFILCYSVIEK